MFGITQPEPSNYVVVLLLEQRKPDFNSDRAPHAIAEKGRLPSFAIRTQVVASKGLHLIWKAKKKPAAS